MLGETRRGNLLNNRTMRMRYKIVPVEDQYTVLINEEEFGEVEEFDYDKAWQIFTGDFKSCVAYIHARENNWL